MIINSTIVILKLETNLITGPHFNIFLFEGEAALGKINMPIMKNVSYCQPRKLTQKCFLKAIHVPI